MTRAARAGFVLLEAVVALLVLGLVGAAALSVAASGLRVSGQTARLVEANALAVDGLDAMRLLTRDEVDHLPDSIAADPGCTVAHVAASLGFSDARTMRRTFEGLTGRRLEDFATPGRLDHALDAALGALAGSEAGLAA